MEKKKLPYGFRIEQARNYLRFHTNKAAAEYDLPGEIIDMILETLLAEEQRQRIALMAEQTDSMLNSEEEEE